MKPGSELDVWRAVEGARDAAKASPGSLMQWWWNFPWRTKGITPQDVILVVCPRGLDDVPYDKAWQELRRRLLSFHTRENSE